MKTYLEDKPRPSGMRFDLQPILEDELILLRPLQEEDFDALYEVARDPLVWEQHPNNDRYRRSVFETLFRESMESKGALVAICKADHGMIGSSRFNQLDGLDDTLEIGWSFLARAYWGGKYNRAMKVLMLNHAFRFVENVVFYIGTANLRSQKAIEKIGAVRISDGAYARLMKKHGPDLTYLITRQDWHSNPLAGNDSVL